MSIPYRFAPESAPGRRPLRTLILAAGIALAAAAPAAAIVPVNGPSPTLTPVAVDVSPGDQYGPLLSGDRAAYTSESMIRYYDFVTGSPATIPPALPPSHDILGGMSGSRIVFSRVTVGRDAVMVFDAASPSGLLEIDPVLGPRRLGTAIGGGQVAYIDFGLQQNGEIVVHDLATSSSTRLTNDAVYDQNPSLSPIGDVLMWERCASSLANCDVWRAIRSGSTWTVAAVAATARPEGNPATDGAIVVYETQLAPDEVDLEWRAVTGLNNPTIEMPGIETSPSIAGNFIGFAHRASSGAAADLFVYDYVYNRLYRLTDTPLVSEDLPDLQRLPDGRFRVAWTSGPFGQRDVHAATFELPADPLPPAFVMPCVLSPEATGPLGAAVAYTVVATDNLPGVTFSCAPVSGSIFPIGMSTVTCRAEDVEGNVTISRFGVAVLPALGTQNVVPVAGPVLAITAVPVNVSQGDAGNPRVSGDHASYSTDVTGRVFDFATGIDAEIPGSSLLDFAHDISGTNVLLTRVAADFTYHILVADAAGVAPPIEVDPGLPWPKFAGGIGTDTVAYVQMGAEDDRYYLEQKMAVHDLASSTTTFFPNIYDRCIVDIPSVSDDGQAVTWGTNTLGVYYPGNVWQIVRSGAGWTAPRVIASTLYSATPDNNGTLVTYWRDVVPSVPNTTDYDVFWRAMSGGPEFRLQLPGWQHPARIAGNLMVFSTLMGLPNFSDFDVFLYDINTNRLYQVASTPGIPEYASDVTILPDGRVRVVWESHDYPNHSLSNVRSATFTLPNADTIPPTLHLPAPISVPAMGPSGAAVAYTVTATDNLPGVTFACAPPSGSVFPIGTSTVACLATDAAGNTTTGDFTILVRGANSQIGDLVTTVIGLNLPNGIENSLLAKLGQVDAALASGNLAAACGSLNAFMNEVQAQSGKKIPVAAATALIAEATRIRAVIGCP